MAARGKRLRPGRGDSPGAADVPDIVKYDGIAGHVKGGESFEMARHD